jgi:aerobic-type carbon monoxide dehydrogenase small subunit (CoxS/CutS family)
MVGTKSKQVSVVVNGKPCSVHVSVGRTLLDLLRIDLGLTGSKKGCDGGTCGCCTVLLDGVPVYSCCTLAVAANNHNVQTIEGLADGPKLHPLQQTFADMYAAQCGYCTPGMIMTAKALLDKTPKPSREQIKSALSGNICRCTGYVKIIEAVEAASKMR